MAKKRYKGYSQSLRKFSAAEDKIIRSMRKRGATGQEIALEIGCHKGPVYRRLREMGMNHLGFWTTFRAEKKKATPKKKKKSNKRSS